MILRKKSLDKILGSFNKTIADLKKLVEANEKKADGYHKDVEWHEDQIADKRYAIRRLNSESLAAANVSKKIEELIAG